MDRRLIVVRRNQLALCDYLRGQFSGDKDVEVILDRRWGERRQCVQAQEPERRRAGRRQEAVREEDLRAHGFVVVRKPEALGLGEIEKLLGELHSQMGVKPPGDPTRGIREKSSIPTQSDGGTTPLKGRAPPNGNGTWKGRAAGAAKPLVSEELSVTPSTARLDQEREEWQRLLDKIGIGGLRLPENGALCSPWRKFLSELRAVT